MFDHFSKLLKENYRIKKEHRLLLAVSGGIDSMVMLHLFLKYGQQIGIAHVNFKLRESESDKDEKLVREIAKENNIPFFCIDSNTQKMAEKWKMSVQMAARKIRYDFFSEVMESESFDYLCTAHHADDSFETAILNFIKSSAYTSFSGIPSKNEHIIRPLIEFSRKEIRDYAEKNKLKWREDKSNDSTKYLRNKVRHELIPVVKEINPSYKKTFAETSEQLKLMKFFISEKLEEAGWIIRDKENIEISISHLSDHPGDLLLLWEIVREKGFNFSDFRQIVKSIHSESGKTFESENYLLVRDRDHFIISPNRQVSEEYLMDDTEGKIEFGTGTLDFKVINRPDDLRSNGKIALLDVDQISLPLKLRPWQDGDKFQPLGMQGEKKISDFMIDLKVPLNEKRKQYVLLSGDEIVWVVGKRISQKFRITDSTTRTLRIELK